MVLKRGSLLAFVFGVVLIVFLSVGVLAVDDLMALQGNVQASGVDLSSGDLVVEIWDSYSGGSVVYNSTTDFNGAIYSGQYDVVLGNGSNELSLDYGRLYYMELYVEGESFTFNGSERQMFQSSVGQINQTFLNLTGLVVDGNLNVTGNLTVEERIGIGTTNPLELLDVRGEIIFWGDDFDTGSDGYIGLRNDHSQLYGSTDDTDLFIGMLNNMEINQNDAPMQDLIGIRNTADNGLGNVSNNIIGLENTATSDGGWLKNIYGIKTTTNVGNAVSDGTGNAYGIHSFISDNQGIDGTVYNLYLQAGNGVDFNLYSKGTGSINYFEGLIGIGTTIPDRALTVNTDANISGMMYVNSTGVGIGTEDIGDYKVKVYGDVNDAVTLGIENANAGNGAYSRLELLSDAASGTLYAFSSVVATIGSSVVLSAGEDSSRLMLATENSTGNIGFYIGDDNWALSTYEKMRLIASGFLGIGTTSPSQMLDVRGQGNFSGTIYINNATDISAWEINISKNYTERTFNTYNSTWDNIAIIRNVNSSAQSINTTANIQELLNLLMFQRTGQRLQGLCM